MYYGSYPKYPTYTSFYTMFLQFSLIDVPKSFFEVLEIAKEKLYGGYLYGDRCAGELITIKLAELINSGQYFENGEDLYYMVYKDIQRLIHMKIKLLYFLPPDNYLSTLPRYDDSDEYYDKLTCLWYESPF